MRTRGSGRTFQRGNIWWVAYFHRAKEIRESSHSTDQRDAVRLLKQRLHEVGADVIGLKPFVGPSQDQVRVSELLDALEQDYRLRAIRSHSMFSHLKTVRAAFGDRRALDLTPEAVDRYIEQQRAVGKADATINRETKLLARAYRLAVERKRLSQTLKVRHLSEAGNARQGFFEHADFEAVVAHLPEYLQDFVRFGYLSAWRKGEISSLTWADVDLEGRTIHLRPEHSKNGCGRTLVLDGELWDLIARQSDNRAYTQVDGTVVLATSVFHHGGRPVVDLRRAWHTACNRAGVPGKMFHDLRRTAIRNMVRAGVSERVAMQVSGHKTRAIFDRYNIVSEGDLREAQRKLQTYLNAAPSERKVVVLSKGRT